MRTSGRLPAGAAAATVEAGCSVTRMFMALLGLSGRSDDAVRGGKPGSQIAGNPQALERVLGLVVHGAARALGDFGAVELDDDLVDRARLRGHRKSDIGIAERAIALSVAREKEGNDR